MKNATVLQTTVLLMAAVQTTVLRMARDQEVKLSTYDETLATLSIKREIYQT